MTARPFTPRDAALDLGRRTQRIRQTLTTHSLGHPLDIARAIGNLAAVRGARIPGGGSTTYPGSFPGPSFPTSAPTSPSTPSPLTDFSGWLESQVAQRTSPYERVPRLDPSSLPREQDDGRRPMDEQPPPLSHPVETSMPGSYSGGWDERLGNPRELDDFLRRRQGAGPLSAPLSDGGFQSLFPGQTLPTTPPGDAFVFNPNVPSPLPGQTASKSGAPSKTGGPQSPGSGLINVQLDVIPRALREELQKMAGAADRALRDFRQVCAMTGTGRRR